MANLLEMFATCKRDGSGQLPFLHQFVMCCSSGTAQDWCRRQMNDDLDTLPAQLHAMEKRFEDRPKQELPDGSVYWAVVGPPTQRSRDTGT